MTKRLKPPLTWFGGKTRMLNKLLPLLPPHHYYLEPFGGSAAMLIAKTPAPFEVYNDIDKKLYTFYKVLRDKEKFLELQRLLELTPYHREAKKECYKRLYTAEDELEIAYCFFVTVRMGFGGKVGNSFGYAIHGTSRNMPQQVASYLSAIDRLPAIHERLRTVQVECQDWRVVVERYNEWGQEGFYYLDPPYVPETRRSGKYDYELTTNDHEELVNWLLSKARVRVMLSGYDNHLPPLGGGRLAQGLLRRSLPRRRPHHEGTGIRGAGVTHAKGQRRTDCVWMNYTPPDRLF